MLPYLYMLSPLNSELTKQGRHKSHVNMNDTEKIIRSSKYIILLGCVCFFIYITFLFVSYHSAIRHLKSQFEESTFPKLVEMIDNRIDLFFKAPVKGLSILADTLDWEVIMKEAASNPAWLKAKMQEWTSELEISSIGISDRNRKLVWDYWSDKPIVLDPSLARDEWFFDFWNRRDIPDWTYALYAEESGGDYELYIDRLVRDRKGRPIGTIAGKISLSLLWSQLMQIISGGEGIIILDDKSHVVIDISRMEPGEGIKFFSFMDAEVKEKSRSMDDLLIKKILLQADDFGSIKTEEENIFYKKNHLFNGSLSILTVMDMNFQLNREKEVLIRNIIVSFVLFTLFIGGVLSAMIFYTQKLKLLAIKLERERSKFEDLLFIITHGFGNEILLLKKEIEGLPRKVTSGIDLRLSEMALMVQNSVNAARLDNSKALIIQKPYSFSWQWEKLTDKFKRLSAVKGQDLCASPPVDCVVDNDEEMVYQILANLVSNAVKYTPEGGRIDLKARIDDDFLIIIIRDSGPGFLPEDRLRLFSKFSRLSAKPTGGERSTGLGLYIVKQLTDACGISLALSKGDGEFPGAVWELKLKRAHSGV